VPAPRTPADSVSKALTREDAVLGRHNVAEREHGALADLLCTSLEYFVMGHEYGHLVAGHLTDADRRAGLVPGSQEVDALEYSWLQELDADARGLVLGVNALQKAKQVDLGLAFAGVDLFFSTMDVMDRAVALLRTGEETTLTLGSHPPAQLRRQAAREALRRLTPPEGAKAVEAAVGLADAQAHAVEQLWAYTREAILRARQAGWQAAGRWRTVPAVPAT
jgi:hypothetical protein